MIRKITSTFTLLTSLSLGACVQNPDIYNWGNYEKTMLEYYKDPSQIDAFEAELLSLIDQAGTDKNRLPPGIYAEYGYLQMKKGATDTAIKFFELEKQTWPESKLLMETMIRAAGGQVKTSQEAKG
ncbi:MAG: DUF4810 domain-containing protein [Methylocystaceae bacterium]|nr:DUF4810 domain-containing protein [Methylocystaceae bacterium]